MSTTPPTHGGTATVPGEGDVELVVTRQRLVELAAGEGGDTGHRLSPALRTVARADRVLDAVRVAADGGRGARVWLADQHVVLHPEAVFGEPRPVVSGRRALAAELLARAVELGPRPAPRELASATPFTATGDAVVAACRGEGPAPWPAQGDQARVWWVSTVVPADGPTGPVTVLDLGSGGLWRPTAEGDEGIVWSPTGVGTVWAALSQFLAE